MKVLLTHPGTQYSYSLAAQLQRTGILFCFASCLAIGDDQDKIGKWLPAGLRKKRQRRVVEGVPSSKIYRNPVPELRALLQLKLGKPSHKVLFARNKKFQEQLPQRLIDAADVVIGFDTSSWILQERCRQAKKPFILDASIAHPLSQRDIFAALKQRFPGWAAQLPLKDQKYIDIEEKEMAAADHIVVASAFTKYTYSLHNNLAGKISINHYGTNLETFWPTAFPVRIGDRPMTFLFFGAITARKGFPWLCEVWESFHKKHPASKLIAAGYGEIPEGFQVPDGIEITGYIHPRDRRSLFHRADVFVFPSFFEGFAQVIIEAMACGLPVITTTHTIGPEVITDGVEGFCISPGDDAALEEKLGWFMKDLAAGQKMGAAAHKKASTMTWDAYGDRWKEIIETLVE